MHCMLVSSVSYLKETAIERDSVLLFIHIGLNLELNRHDLKWITTLGLFQQNMLKTELALHLIKHCELKSIQYY